MELLCIQGYPLCTLPQTCMASCLLRLIRNIRYLYLFSSNSRLFLIIEQWCLPVEINHIRSLEEKTFGFFYFRNSVLKNPLCHFILTEDFICLNKLNTPCLRTQVQNNFLSNVFLISVWVYSNVSLKLTLHQKFLSAASVSLLNSTTKKTQQSINLPRIFFCFIFYCNKVSLGDFYHAFV